MNERIKELAEQSEGSVEKFAELIVKDICDMVNKHIQWNNPNDCPLVLDIKERYGIER